MIKGLETSAVARGFDLFLCTEDYQPERAQAAVRKMIENGVRGVAIITSSLTEQIAVPLAGRDIPVVMLDLQETRRYISGISGIAIDYNNGVWESMEHLPQLEHKQIAFLSGPDDRRSSRRYRGGILKTVHHH